MAALAAILLPSMHIGYPPSTLLEAPEEVGGGSPHPSPQGCQLIGRGHCWWELVCFI